MEHLIIILLLIWLVWRTRSTKTRYYAWGCLFEQLNEIEALLAKVPVKEIKEKRERAEEAFILRHEERSWLYSLGRPRL